jgi:FkbM family methyltransferase
METIDTLYGPISVPDWPDDLIVRALHAFGEWAPIEQRLFARLIRKYDRVFDGGAFLGSFGLGAAQLAAGWGQSPSKLLAIEPSPVLHPYLRASLEANCPCDWDLAPYAIGLEETTLVPAGDTDDNQGALAYVSATEDTTSSEDAITALPLWRIREAHGDYDCLKLDVEGWEFEAISSDFDYIKVSKPVIWAECNEAPGSLKVMEAMTGLGYEPYYVAFPAFRTDNFKQNPDSFFPMAYEAVLVGAEQGRLESLLDDIDPAEIIVASVRDNWDLRQAMWRTPRWADKGWIDLSRPELIALLGRAMRGEDLGAFLND